MHDADATVSAYLVLNEHWQIFYLKFFCCHAWLPFNVIFLLHFGPVLNSQIKSDHSG